MVREDSLPGTPGTGPLSVNTDAGGEMALLPSIVSPGTFLELFG